MEDWKTRITQIRPAPIPVGDPERACLVLIYPPGTDLGKRFELGEAPMTIGRRDCDIQVDRDSVSRKHARIDPILGDGEINDFSGADVTDGEILADPFVEKSPAPPADRVAGWRVVDLDSTNGTFVNDQPVRRHILQDGDLLKIGNAIFKFLTGGSVETAYHEEIYRMTIIDGLTQAHNKRYLVENLERELARSGRSKRTVSLVMFDLDHFKRINDRHGHLTGDYVLKELARRIRARVRRDEIFARYGGEEFAVLLPEATAESALHFAEQVRHLVEAEAFHFEGQKLAVTVSVGVASVADEVAVDAFIKMADDRLYKAKRAGRNRVVSTG